MIDKSKYALLWANGMTFAEIFDLIVGDYEAARRDFPPVSTEEDDDAV